MTRKPDTILAAVTVMVVVFLVAMAVTVMVETNAQARMMDNCVSNGGQWLDGDCRSK